MKNDTVTTKRPCSCTSGKSHQIKEFNEHDEPIWFCTCCYKTSERTVRRTKHQILIDKLNDSEREQS